MFENKYYDENQIRKAIALMKPNNQLYEVRIVYGNKKTSSGYFRGADDLIRELKKQLMTDCNIYITLNFINDACHDRTQKDHFEITPKTTTNDNDITGYNWLMVDIDPKRPAGTSSTNEQVEKAKELANRVYEFMRDLGFERPLVATSGNGAHLLYKVHLSNTPERKKLMETALKTLDLLFSNDEVAVDVANFNPSRICKLYGTMAQKGSNTPEHPHRLSWVLSNTQDIKINDIKYIEKLVSYYPQEVEKPQRYNNYNPSTFDLEEWMTRYGIRYRKDSYSGGRKFILEACPFDANHTGKDACIFQSSNGAIGFHCFHSSCADKTWKDVRMLFEPDAYEQRNAAQQKIMYKSFNRDRHVETKKIEQKDNVPVFLSAMDIFTMPTPAETFIRTGITEIDRKIRGLKKGQVSVWSGLRGSAKSTVLSEIGLNAVDDGNNVAFFSGELSEKNFIRWMFLQAAGKGYVEPSQYEGYYNVPRMYQELIATWLGKKFWLYNNKYGNDASAILDLFEKTIDEKKLDFLVLDNLMAFDLYPINENKWEAQTQFVWKLHEMAQRTNVHIAFVAHPRKAMGFLRLDDISGSADIANAVEYAFIVHRNNNDFKRKSKEMFGWKDDEDIYEGSNIIEVAKDRDGGTQDLFVPLYYEVETKRIKNTSYENKIYGWVNADLGDASEFNEGFEVASFEQQEVFT